MAFNPTKRTGRSWAVGVVAWLLGASFMAQAIAEELVQPDGSLVRLVPLTQGDVKFFEDEQGYTVVLVGAHYEYAVAGDDGSLIASGIELGAVDPRRSALPKDLAPTPEFMRRSRVKRPPRMGPRSPLPIKVTLSDGSQISLTFKGTGVFSWYQDPHGYAIVETPPRYEYGLRGPGGHLIPCGILVGSMNPGDAGLKQHIRPAAPSHETNEN